MNILISGVLSKTTKNIHQYNKGKQCAELLVSHTSSSINAMRLKELFSKKRTAKIANSFADFLSRFDGAAHLKSGF
jgi:hypothetical protein